MENLLRELLDKVEEIKQNQQTILSRLDDSLLYPKPVDGSSSNKSKTKKEEEREQIEKYKLLLIHGPKIKSKFNLMAVPSPQRILTYLKTGNASVFDGLKRKN